MSDGIRVEIESVPDIEAIRTKAKLAIRRQMGIHADAMKNHASTKVPVRTGRLQQSINTRVSASKSAVTITIGANARSDNADGTGEMYGPFVEYGTGQKGMAGGNTYDGHTNDEIEYNAAWPGMDARPFIRPAVYDLQEQLVKDLGRAIAEAVK